MGKKQTCPYCKEKVDLKRLFPGPYPFVSVKCILYFHRHVIVFVITLNKFFLHWNYLNSVSTDCVHLSCTLVE